MAMVLFPPRPSGKTAQTGLSREPECGQDAWDTGNGAARFATPSESRPKYKCIPKYTH
jgi:hypothetical protein